MRRKLAVTIVTSGGGIIGVVSVELGNFFTSGPFDPALREIWIIGAAVAIPVIIFLKRRRRGK